MDIPLNPVAGYGFSIKDATGIYEVQVTGNLDKLNQPTARSEITVRGAFKIKAQYGGRANSSLSAGVGLSAGRLAKMIPGGDEISKVFKNYVNPSVGFYFGVDAKGVYVQGQEEMGTATI